MFIDLCDMTFLSIYRNIFTSSQTFCKPWLCCSLKDINATPLYREYSKNTLKTQTHTHLHRHLVSQTYQASWYKIVAQSIGVGIMHNTEKWGKNASKNRKNVFLGPENFLYVSLLCECVTEKVLCGCIHQGVNFWLAVWNTLNCLWCYKNAIDLPFHPSVKACMGK